MLDCKMELLANVEKIDDDSFARTGERGTEARGRTSMEDLGTVETNSFSKIEVFTLR